MLSHVWRSLRPARSNEKSCDKVCVQRISRSTTAAAERHDATPHGSLIPCPDTHESGLMLLLTPGLAASSILMPSRSGATEMKRKQESRITCMTAEEAVQHLSSFSTIRELLVPASTCTHTHTHTLQPLLLLIIIVRPYLIPRFP